MKKLITAVLMLSAVFFSCNQGVNGEYATVVLDLAGSSSGGRAIAQNGLPYLEDTHITIEANGRVGGAFVKDFPPEKNRSVALRLIAGDTVHLRVKASNASGIWSGSTTFTVEDGTNAVFVKLNKTISGAQALTFSMTKTDSVPPHYIFTLNAGNKRISPPPGGNADILPFCRDGKGNIYIAKGNNLYFYTSEGDDSSGTPTVVTGNIKQLVGDSKTGKVYLLDDNKKLYDVQAESPLSNWPSVSLSSAGFSTGDARIYLIAAHDGQLFVFGRQTPTDNGLYVYDIKTTPSFQLTVVTNKEIDELPSGPTSKYTDMFVTDDAVYLLRKEYAVPPVSSGNVYSKGALIKYDYDKDDKEIDDKEEFGTSDNGTQNGIVLTPDTSFYGPLKFIGFDDDVLYIADDGVKFTYFNEVPRITANKNRIASFNTSTKSLSFTDISATWAKEEKVWSPPQKIKTLLWKKGIGGFDYYAVDSADSPLGAHPDLESQYSSNSYIDVFCFDQAGNLYVVKEESGDYKVARYEPTADGGYDFANPVPLSTPLGTDKIKSIAVDVSGSIEEGGYRYNALYYIPDGSGDDKLHRLLWKVGDSFSSAAAYSYNPISIGPSASALAANKDGVFVATRERSGHNYTLKVYKLAHTGSALPAASLIVGTGTTQNTADPDITYDEQINALQIVNGVLYGVSTKTMKKGYPIKTTAFSMSGKLLKLGNTNGSFNATLNIDTALLYGTKDVIASSNGGFAPYRFIALKPKKLVIASDGAYGQEGTTEAQNKNRVLVFTLDGSGSAGVSASFDVTVEFSKRLTRNDTCGFKWE